MKRQNISSETKWEPLIGYSRAVKIGNQIFVTGTTSIGVNGDVVGINDSYVQTVQAIKNIETALKKAGATLKDVVRTRMFVTNIDEWEKIGRAHKEYFGGILPATTMVEIKRLISPELLVEIEADAVIAAE